MSSVSIKRCDFDSIDSVMEFIDRHWSEGHVLSWCRPLVDFQHRDSECGGFTYLLADRNGELLGILGYIANRLYDPALASRNTVWLALWKVREDAGFAGLGLLLLRRLLTEEPHEAAGVIGIGNAAQLPMYRALGFTTGELTQYYRLHPTISDFGLIRLGDAPARPPTTGHGRLEPIASEDDLTSLHSQTLRAPPGQVPAKSPQYLSKRYFRHPVYEYRLDRVVLNGIAVGVLVSRIADHAGRSALRIVDYQGPDDAFAELGPAFDTLLVETGAEYLDFWQYGMRDEVVADAGLVKVDPEGATIVPNYFEPFVQRNARILCAVRAPSGAPVRMFRADGDQDRPNRISPEAVMGGE